MAVELAIRLGFGVETVDVLPGGNQNHVVRVRGPVTDVVVRFARDPAGLTSDPFDIEQWCSGAAAAAGVTTPRTLARQRCDGFSVIVQEFVPGEPARADDLHAWEAIGRIATKLAEVDTRHAPDELFSRFGRDLRSAWVQHLDYNLDALATDDPLRDLGVYAAGHRTALIEMLRRLRARPLDQGLSHGDLSTRNLLAVAGGYAVLDWGSAGAGPVPWTDLEQIYRWHVTADPVTQVSEDAWLAVLSGAGLSGPGVPALIDELQILHVLDVVRWARDRRPDRLPGLVREARSVISRVLPAAFSSTGDDAEATSG